MCDSVEYLGYTVDSEGLHVTPSKKEAIVNAPQPQNVTELTAYLGLVNYYGKFIPNLASILQPLNSLLQKNCKWVWSEKCSEAVQEATEKLTSSTVLIHYNPSLPIRLAADVSQYGFGTVLFHITPDGVEKPIAFASQSLSKAERNYSQMKKEGLSLIFGVQHYIQIYLPAGMLMDSLDFHYLLPRMSQLKQKDHQPYLVSLRLVSYLLLVPNSRQSLVMTLSYTTQDMDGQVRYEMN